MKLKTGIFLAALTVAYVGSVVAWGQVNRSVQMTQDPTGFITADVTNRHLHLPSAGAGTPALSSCGTSPSITGNDLAGTFTTGSAATTCTLTFATAYPAAPYCFVVPQGNLNFPTYTTSTTALTITVDVASTAYNYLCVGH